MKDHRGAVVKTIGDAVMGAFPTAADAVACALAMQRAIRALETDGAIDPARLLKIGIHAGPCIAVTANGRLDYFGTTINTAARVEHECRGGQIVLTGEVQRDPAVQAILRGAGVEAEAAEVRLQGGRRAGHDLPDRAAGRLSGRGRTPRLTRDCNSDGPAAGLGYGPTECCRPNAA